ncbi:MAG TPA: GNAT family N-acetyltransferase, partial [Caldilineaceae bacterium]|nr:GNAT family N-acetyltransferase [Caldilineaceae bacterium]
MSAVNTSIVALAPAHAAAAARLHIESQPGAFLPSLGPGVLAALYRTLPATTVGFGFVAVAPAEHPPASPVVGFISATSSVGRLFVEVGGALLPPLLARLARRPALIGRSLQTLLYPLLTGDAHDKTPSPVEGGSAELLSIMVEPAWRGQGIGGQLLDALVSA